MFEDTQPSLWDMLNEYADIQDELQDALQSFEFLDFEIRSALDDIREQLESILHHINKCYGTLRIYKVSPATEWPL